VAQANGITDYGGLSTAGARITTDAYGGINTPSDATDTDAYQSNRPTIHRPSPPPFVPREVKQIL
jgi:hypothetical protein